MTPADFEKESCVVDGEPKHHVLAGDPQAMALFDALDEKGVSYIKAAFRTTDGFPCIEAWNAVLAKGERMSSITLLKVVAVHLVTLERLILRGLEMSLADVWDFQNDLVANVYVDVKSRSINVADIRELMFEGDLPNPDGGIDL